ncbi:hypothetical protein [Roseococcus sp. YIM B11640]|uniref:hypothetical protein n=1 Tax=Roseococcus sp. YIM B11640 TaxID=3133973 RepID=UPI003C7A9768
MDDHRPNRPVLDMTPEGEFRQPPPPSGFNAFVARLGGVAILLALAAGGLLLVALAIFFIGLLIPVALGAGLVAAVSMWWRRRQLRRMGYELQPIRIVIRR